MTKPPQKKKICVINFKIINSINSHTSFIFSCSFFFYLGTQNFLFCILIKFLFNEFNKFHKSSTGIESTGRIIHIEHTKKNIDNNDNVCGSWGWTKIYEKNWEFLWLIKRGKEGLEEGENFNWNFEEIEIKKIMWNK